jgi:hypothetical protein
MQEIKFITLTRSDVAKSKSHVNPSAIEFYRDCGNGLTSIMLASKERIFVRETIEEIEVLLGLREAEE